MFFGFGLAVPVFTLIRNGKTGTAQHLVAQLFVQHVFHKNLLKEC
jgi:hypothetical protein